MSIKYLLSPTEHDLAVGLGGEAVYSPLPEQKGADILIYSSVGLMGIQRKKVPHDFISSFTDGRLARSLPLIKESCTFQRVLGEGKFRYYQDTTVDLGFLKPGVRIPSRFTKSSIKAMINDVELVHGVMVDWTDDLSDTVLYLKAMSQFLAGKTHLGLFKRPNVQGLWSVPTSKEIELWILQSFPSIGPTTADRIIQFFGGSIPMKWTCSVDELCMITGITRKKATEIHALLPIEAPTIHPELGKKVRPSVGISFNVNEDTFNSLRNKLRRPHA